MRARMTKAAGWRDVAAGPGAAGGMFWHQTVLFALYVVLDDLTSTHPTYLNGCHALARARTPSPTYKTTHGISGCLMGGTCLWACWWFIFHMCLLCETLASHKITWKKHSR